MNIFENPDHQSNADRFVKKVRDFTEGVQGLEIDVRNVTSERIEDFPESLDIAERLSIKMNRPSLKVAARRVSDRADIRSADTYLVNVMLTGKSDSLLREVGRSLDGFAQEFDGVRFIEPEAIDQDQIEPDKHEGWVSHRDYFFDRKKTEED